LLNFVNISLEQTQHTYERTIIVRFILRDVKMQNEE